MAAVLHLPRRTQEVAMEHDEGDTVPSDKPTTPTTSLAAKSTRRKTKEKTAPRVLVTAMNSGKVSLPFLLRLHVLL